MADERQDHDSSFYVIALTGGPCGGKTTVQALLYDVFENMGWKVYRVPETATVLLEGGVHFGKLQQAEADQFQADLLKTMMTIEDTYVNLAKSHAARGVKTMVICDRGTMDPSAYISRPEWLKLLERAGLDEINLRDHRYNIVVHLVSAAYGAEPFYGSESNRVRVESVEHARHLDDLVSQAWLGHPYFEIVDNSTGFEEKKNRVVQCILRRLGLTDARRGDNIIKRKFLLKNFDMDAPFPIYHRDFEVEHNYLLSTDNSQIRIRKRGIDGSYVFTVTTRKPAAGENGGEMIELRRVLDHHEYSTLWSQRDLTHCSVIKKRRCFLYDNRFYQLDMFESPHPGLIMLEAYVKVQDHGSASHDAAAAADTVGSVTSPAESDFCKLIPSFMQVEREVTDDPAYSMFNLSKIESTA